MQAIELVDADLRWVPNFLEGSEHDSTLIALTQEIAWERHRLRLFGRLHDAPRLSCWIGDPGAGYTYSGTRFEPRPWPLAMSALRRRLREISGEYFNSVLANRYRDGADSMGWHSDDEPELGAEPVIASVSLGAARRFVMRHRRSGARYELVLTPGSLLLMRGPTQRCWQHALPKTAKAVGERLNLTFRQILDPAGEAIIRRDG